VLTKAHEAFAIIWRTKFVSTVCVVETLATKTDANAYRGICIYRLSVDRPMRRLRRT
jgi:hypothetical protein